MKTETYEIQIERVHNGWIAKIWRHTPPRLVKLVADSYGELNDLVFSVVAEQDVPSETTND